MVIRSKHLDSLAAGMQTRFEKDLVEHLRERYGVRFATTTDASLIRLAKHGISQAAQYNIRVDYDVRRYVEYMAEFGPDFDVSPETPWAGRILTNNETGTEKMDALDAFTTFELRRRSA